MTSRFTATLAAFALFALALATPALAQQGPRMSLKVSHDFTVGEKTLPAGEYTIRRASAGNPRVFVIEEATGAHAVVVMGLPSTAGEAPAGDALTFTRCGGEYFLTSVCAAGEARAYRFAPSERQQEALARAGARPETVTVRATVNQ